MFYLKLIRPQHWVKNLLIFLPIFFSGRIFDIYTLKTTILGFISFSFLASSIYIINDIADIAQDRLHEKKKNRPIASGKVPVSHALVLVAACMLTAVVFNWGTHSGLLACLLMLIYFALNLLYSKGLKNIPLLDVAIIASGFLIRLFYGGVITDIVISEWLYLMIVSFSFFMGFGKRRNEIIKSGEHSRKVLKYYSSCHFL